MAMSPVSPCSFPSPPFILQEEQGLPHGPCRRARCTPDGHPRDPGIMLCPPLYVRSLCTEAVPRRLPRGYRLNHLPSPLPGPLLTRLLPVH